MTPIARSIDQSLGPHHGLPESVAMVSDALGQQLGVAPQAAQARQLRVYQAQK